MTDNHSAAEDTPTSPIEETSPLLMKNDTVTDDSENDSEGKSPADPAAPISSPEPPASTRDATSENGANNDRIIEAAFASSSAPDPVKEKTSKTRDLEAEIFGDSESDMSDLEELNMSSDEEDRPAPRSKATRTPTPPPAPSPKRTRDEDYTDDDPPMRSTPAKGGKRRGSVLSSSAGTVKRGRKIRSEHSAAEMASLPLEQMTSRQRAEAVVHEDFKNAMAAISSSGHRKVKGEQNIEMDVDKMMEQLREKMKTAAYKDVEANESQQPAMNKMRMLPTVVKQLQKAGLYDQFIDNNILEAIKIWLEPLTDGSLPSLDIIINLFNILEKMPISTDNLRESNLGRIIKFYTIVPAHKITEAIQRQARRMIQQWTRPIIQTSANYRDMKLKRAGEDLDNPEYDEPHHQSSHPSSRRPSSQSQSKKQRTETLTFGKSIDVLTGASQDRSDEPKKGQPGYYSARIPQAAAANYDIAPKSTLNEQQMAHAKLVGDRNKQMRMRLTQIKKKNTGASGPSNSRFSLAGKGISF